MAEAASPRTRKVITTTQVDEPMEPDRITGFGGGHFSEILRDIPDDDLELYEVTIYRRAPINEGHIVKLGGSSPYRIERIDEQWIGDRLGGGTYQVKIYEKRDRRTAFQECKIAGEPKPSPFAPRGTTPVIGQPAQAVVAAPATATDPAMQQVIELLNKTIDRLSQLQEARSAQPASNPASDHAIDIVSAAAKKGFELLGSMGGNKSGDNLDAELRAAVLRKMLAEPEKPKGLIEQLGDLKQLRDLFMPAAPGSVKSLGEQLKEIIEVAGALGLSKGGGGEETPTTLMDLAKMAVERGPEIIGKVREIAQDRVALEEARTRRAQVQAATGPRPVYVPPQPLPAGNPPQTPAPGTHSSTVMPASSSIRYGGPAGGNGAAADAGGTHSAPSAPAALDTESPAFIQHVKESIVRMVHEGFEGASIVDFLRANRQGELVRLLAEYTPQQITDLLKADPILAQAANHLDWPAVLEEAREYVAQLRAEQAAGTQTPAPAKVN
jgi:hypothetical protein